jgi:mannose-6-phosphate isomerase-like protein (cupin superfamily)
MEARIIKNGEGEFIIEGEECTQIYFRTDKMVFSISTLLPGQKACLDKGHEDSHEICYVVKGNLIMHLPEKNKYFHLNPGDAILIPEGESHYSINVGEEISLTVWACAPSL